MTNFNNSKSLYLSFIVAIMVTYLIPPYAIADRIGNHWIYLSTILLIITGFFQINRINIFKIEKESNETKYILWAYTSFILISTFSLFVAENKVESLVVISQQLTVFISFLILLKISSVFQEYQKTMFGVLYVFLIIELIFSSTPLIIDLSNNVMRMRSNDYVGLMSNINITSFSILYKLPVILYFYEKNKLKAAKVFNLIILSISFLTIIAIGSRASYLAIIACLIFYVLYKIFLDKRKSIKKILALTFTLIATIFFSIILSNKSNSQTAIDRVATINFNNIDGSTQQRINYYKSSFEIFKKHPIFGIGIGNWKYKSIEYNRFNLNGYIVPFVTHNDFLQVLNETGLFGFISYLLIFIFIMYSFLKRKNDKNLFFVILFMIIYVIDSLLNFPLVRTTSQIQFIIFLSIFFHSYKLSGAKE